MAIRRVYATPADLADYLGTAAPSDAQRLLTRASEDIDTALLTSIYPVDNDGYPTLTDQREAVRDAACAIVEWWQETGDETGASSGWSSVTAGSVSLSRASSSGGSASSSSAVRPGWLPSRAWGYLTRSGLLMGTAATW